jgi:hypothetical protein
MITRQQEITDMIAGILGLETRAVCLYLARIYALRVEHLDRETEIAIGYDGHPGDLVAAALAAGAIDPGLRLKDDLICRRTTTEERRKLRSHAYRLRKMRQDQACVEQQLEAEQCPDAASEERREQLALVSTPEVLAPDVMRVIVHWRAKHPRSLRSVSSTTREVRLIKARLKEGYAADDLCSAIDGMHRSPYHRGENETGQKYLSLELCVRDAKHVDQFVALATGPEPRRKTREELQAEQVVRDVEAYNASCRAAPLAEIDPEQRYQPPEEKLTAIDKAIEKDAYEADVTKNQHARSDAEVLEELRARISQRKGTQQSTGLSAVGDLL